MLIPNFDPGASIPRRPGGGTRDYNTLFDKAGISISRWACNLNLVLNLSRASRRKHFNLDGDPGAAYPNPVESASPKFYTLLHGAVLAKQQPGNLNFNFQSNVSGPVSTRYTK